MLKANIYVPFEAYLHYAAIQRTKEEQPSNEAAIQEGDTAASAQGTNDQDELEPTVVIDGAPTPPLIPSISSIVSDHGANNEEAHAKRIARTASWLGVFYLITTDILGPGAAP